MHEHLDEMGIIHMNGRIYDPYTGRFMSADPFIQSPDNLQSYNRYAYVMNNPLNMTDPSGYFSLRKAFRVAVAIYVGVQFGQWVGGQLASGVGFSGNAFYSVATTSALGPVAPGLTALGGAVVGAAGGFATGFIASGGSANAGLQGALGGALFGAAGTVGNPNDNIRYAAHATAGCVSAVAGGGKCGQGLTAAVFGKYTTNQIEGWGGANKNSVEWLIAKGVATSIAGGAGSVIAGGKFDNGAATAAMGYLFNQVATILRLAGTYGPPLVAAAATQLDNLKEGARALSVMLSEKADTPKGQTDTAIDELTGGLNNETDTKGRPTAGQYVKPGGNAQQDLDALPGTTGANGQKTLPDGSVAGTHTSTTTGLDTLHIHRPRGSRDIKIRYPE
jgi:RHS repeat-associated protein